MAAAEMNRPVSPDVDNLPLDGIPILQELPFAPDQDKQGDQQAAPPTR